MALEPGSLGTTFAWVLVTRGPGPAFYRPNREEGGSLVTRFRSGLVPQGPPTQEILGSWGPPREHAWTIKGLPRNYRGIAEEPLTDHPATTVGRHHPQTTGEPPGDERGQPAGRALVQLCTYRVCPDAAPSSVHASREFVLGHLHEYSILWNTASSGTERHPVERFWLTHLAGRSLPPMTTDAAPRVRVHDSARRRSGLALTALTSRATLRLAAPIRSRC